MHQSEARKPRRRRLLPCDGSADLLRLYRQLDNRGEEPVIIDHSHTATEAYRSRTDVSYASEPGVHYVVVSTAGSGGEDFAGLRACLPGRVGMRLSCPRPRR
ncbi:Mov34/MPN/PAD-1 family protein [Streptomyces sp. H10-C2]|uniref:Mov34/MPN/PAD-1 family protein n=1 Tax=unclassified Streptomyces TaxID=2593676 RepID=UPI0024B9D8DA|nr:MULTISPECIES: Mov34/MPN/PAD-1 family protein [unclassified Streptomyces]MDJ0343952.1 Mov34/MPN/PAD-1 family protein [Streptomyces sp. PH10-H1]MDJ0373393.1 Mov34/MPN/PAD-1 family protein [Streptomyces sp. H10-C2]